MEPILKGHFTRFKNSFELDKSPDKLTSALWEAQCFEQFVNYVLFSMDYPDIFTGDQELLNFVTVGGGDDTGPDGIGIKINGRIIRNIDEVNEIAKTSLKIEIEFVFIQAKMSPRVDTAKLNKFGTAVKMFFNEEYLPQNQSIRMLREIKDHVLSDQLVISRLISNPSISLYFVTTGGELPDANVSGIIAWIERELIGLDCFDSVTCKTLGSKNLVRACRELENKFETQIMVNDMFPLIVSAPDVKRADAFTCSATEFLS